jgi:anaerobic selenocysteine-containing dehydrogenase
MEKVEFCVVLDFYINETANFGADYILPVRTPLENSNAPIYLLNYQVYPHLHYSHALVEPEKYGPKPEWEILLSLARLLKVPMFGSNFLNSIPKIYRIFRKEFHPEFFIKLFLFLGQVLEKKIPHLSSGTFTVKKLKKLDTVLLGPNKYGVLKNYLRNKEKKITFLNHHLEEQIDLCKKSIEKKIDEVKEIDSKMDEFLMIGRRNLKTMNSWMHNVAFLWRKKQEPKLFINTHDAENLNLKNDDNIIIENKLGSVTVPIEITERIMSGVICYPHGWGHKNPKLSFANQHPGENINVLTDSHKLDKLSGQPVMNGYNVRIRKAN